MEGQNAIAKHGITAGTCLGTPVSSTIESIFFTMSMPRTVGDISRHKRQFHDRRYFVFHELDRDVFLRFDSTAR